MTREVVTSIVRLVTGNKSYMRRGRETTEKKSVALVLILACLAASLLAPAAFAGGEFCQWCIFENCENTGYGFRECWIQTIQVPVCLEWDLRFVVPTCRRYGVTQERICRTSGNCDFAF